MYYYIKTWFGFFVVDDSGEIVRKNLYPKDIDQLIQKNKKQISLQEVREKMDIEVKEPDKELVKVFKEKYWEKFEKEYKNLKKDFYMRYAREKIQRGFKEKGESIIRAVNLLEDVNKSNALLSEGYKDFFDLFFEGKDIETIYNTLEEKEIKNNAEETVKSLSNSFIAIEEAKDKIEEYITTEMKEFAPNISEIAGEILGAKLISLSGGLEKLAKKPSGTIQVLGAEQALFRHLRTGTEPPKHGVIFEHPYVRNTHWSKRGKIARSLASKIALAARIDYYSKENKSKRLKDKLRDRVEKVRGE